MSSLDAASSFLQRAKVTKSIAELRSLLEDGTKEIGFRYFALVHHVDFRLSWEQSLLLHNYPDAWAARFIAEGLHVEDPIHQACLRSNVGFAWTELSALIPLTTRQRMILDTASKHGLRFGFTTPANVPGKYGSCPFAAEAGPPPPPQNLMLAQLIGGFAFQAARRIRLLEPATPRSPVHLTPRQRDCLLFAIRGKTDWEISRILGLSEETVSRHLDMARARYGAVKRLQLAAHAILDGEVSLLEALAGQVPLKRK